MWTEIFIYDIWPQFKIHASRCSPGTISAVANLAETRWLQSQGLIYSIFLNISPPLPTLPLPPPPKKKPKHKIMLWLVVKVIQWCKWTLNECKQLRESMSAPSIIATQKHIDLTLPWKGHQPICFFGRGDNQPTWITFS